MGGTYEYQPGQLLNWGRIFFNGNLDDIKKDNPEIALQPDGTFDPTKTWFNIDAGFVRATADQPGQFQKRVFPFRIEVMRGQSKSFVNANIARTFDLGSRRTFSSGWTSRTCSTGSTTEPRPEPDQHELRAGPGGDQRLHAVHHVQRHDPLLARHSGAGFLGTRRSSFADRFRVVAGP